MNQSQNPLLSLSPGKQRELMRLLDHKSENQQTDLSRRQVLKRFAAATGGATIGMGGLGAFSQRVRANADVNDADGNIGLPNDRVDVYADGLDTVFLNGGGPIADGDSIERQVWVIGGNESTPGGATAPDIVFKSETSIPPSGISRYEFEQNALDTWGNNDGTVTGGSFTTDNVQGSYALATDGTDDRLELPDANFHEGNDFTVTFWIKLRTIPSSGNRTFLTGPGFDGSVHPLHIVYDNANHSASEQPIIRSYDGTNDEFIGLGETVSVDTWTFLAVSLDWSNGDVTWYKDGSTPAATGSLPTSHLITNSTQYGVGALINQGSWTLFADAIFDDVSWYDKVLTDSEVGDAYDRGSP